MFPLTRPVSLVSAAVLVPVPVPNTPIAANSTARLEAEHAPMVAPLSKAASAR